MFSIHFRHCVWVRYLVHVLAHVCVRVCVASSITMTFASHVKTVWAMNLRYLGQRNYRSGIMYWMTFWWPWPKVTAVTLINKNLLVCKINWEPLNQLLQSLVVIFFGHAYYLSRFWRNSIRNFFLPNFLWKFRMCIFKIIHSIVHILGMVGPIDVKQKVPASVW